MPFFMPSTIILQLPETETEEIIQVKKNYIGKTFNPDGIVMNIPHLAHSTQMYLLGRQNLGQEVSGL